jgi:hypothetical protein
VHNLQDWDKNKKLDTSNLYLQIKLHQSRTCWKIKFPLTPEQKLERLKKKSRKSKNNYEKVEDYREIEVETREAQNITYHHLKFMRVLYFFSENQDIG